MEIIFLRKQRIGGCFCYCHFLQFCQSMKMEKHVKKMKSRKYIQNLKAYPEIFKKLKLKFC